METLDGVSEMEKGKKLADLLAKVGINTTSVLVIGQFAHIDSFKKYRDQIVNVMTTSGFVFHMERDEFHMDGSNGYRIVFKA